MKKIQIDVEKLRHLVEVEDMQQWKIAELLGVSRDTIGRNCKAFGIKTQKTGPRRGERHTGWKGGTCLLKGYLYIYCPDHPNCTKKGQVAEHRLVVEKKLGRFLNKKEVVHHKDGNPLNNDPDNLVVFQTNGKHLAHELKGKVPNWTPEGWERMQIGCRRKPNRKK